MTTDRDTQSVRDLLSQHQPEIPPPEIPPPANMRPITSSGNKVATDGTGSLSDDSRKPPLDMISPYFLDDLAFRLGTAALPVSEGGGGYVRDNWSKGQEFTRCIGRVLRHIRGFQRRDESEDHLGGGAFGLMCLSHYREMIRLGHLPPSLDDRPYYIQQTPALITTATAYPASRDALLAGAVPERITRPRVLRGPDNFLFVHPDDQPSPQNTR